MITKSKKNLPINNDGHQPSNPFFGLPTIGNSVIPKHMASAYDLYLSGEVEAPEEYIDWFEIIRSAGPNDLIRIHINSYGGDMFTAIQFMKVIGEAQCYILCSAEGACMSAATLIFLSGDMFEISPHSMFMIHNYSGLVVGKGGEMYDNIVHEKKWSEKLLRDVYTGFLTPKEINLVLDNKDLWMDAEEVQKRLNAYIKNAEKAANKIKAMATSGKI